WVSRLDGVAHSVPRITSVRRSSLAARPCKSLSGVRIVYQSGITQIPCRLAWPRRHASGLEEGRLRRLTGRFLPHNHCFAVSNLRPQGFDLILQLLDRQVVQQPGLHHSYRLLIEQWHGRLLSSCPFPCLARPCLT